MARKLLNELLRRYGAWRLAQYGLVAAAVGLVVVLLVELLVPLRSHANRRAAAAGNVEISARGVPEIPQPTTTDFQELTKVFRAGLFKAATPLGDKPLADRTIERIRSKLALKGILTIKGQQVAYIHVKGTGLKPCKTGDSVGDLFTVLNVGERSVEISIVGHRVTLSH